MKILTSADGLFGQEINRYSYIYDFEKWYQFDMLHPKLHLTAPHTPNVEVEAVEIMMEHLIIDSDDLWRPCQIVGDNEYLCKKGFEQKKFYQIQPIPEKEEKGEFIPIICGETCGCKGRIEKCSIGKGNVLNTPLRIDDTKKVEAITYQQILTLPNNEFGHKYQPGYDNINGNYKYFGTSPDLL